MNWIEKALDEIGNSAIGDREHWKQIILSHAPVIDAVALAKKLLSGTKTINMWQKDYALITNDVNYVTQLITSSIDLNIAWVDGEGRWGIFELSVEQIDGAWWYQLFLDKHVIAEDGVPYSSQALAQQACEQALRSIVCGVLAPTKLVTKHRE